MGSPSRPTGGICKGRDQVRAAAEEPAHGPPPLDASPREANAHRLRTPEGRDLYKRRGATVEPGIGNLKKIINRFSRRGLDNATSELHLAATAFNLMKVHKAGPGGLTGAQSRTVSWTWSDHDRGCARARPVGDPTLLRASSN